MPEESRTVELSLVGVGGVWVAGVLLLLWESGGGPEMAGEWALGFSAAAAAWTVIIAMNRCRQRLHDAIASELAFHARSDDYSDGPRSVQ